MQQINIALFTAASCAGKTTIASRIKLPILDCDSEVFNRSFEIFRKPELGQAISPLSAWAHLRKDFDFDRLFRLHHRDWYARSGTPESFVAVGWIYCFREWREQVRSAFNQFHQYHFNFRLFVLRLSHEEFFERYTAAQKERFGNGYGYFNKTPDEQRNQSDEHYNRFLNHHLELPTNNEIPCEQLENDDELITQIAEFCRQ